VLYNKHTDAENFAEILKNVNLPNKITIGKFELKGKLMPKTAENYVEYENDYLENKHQYIFPLQMGNLEISLRLYENDDNHFRLYCLTHFGSKQGMTFSINLTTEKESDDIIFLKQKLKFAEQYKGSQSLAKAHRRQKQIVFCEILSKLGMEITDNNELILGIFDPLKKEFVNTSENQFLNDILVVAIMKGHFQGNKGYQLEILPTYNKLDYIFKGKDDTITTLPIKTIKNKSKRHIPDGLRYKVLRNDNFTCVACKSTTNHGVILHVDHKKPFSLGGLTELNNLQTLCSRCNIGKSNRYSDA
jgi:hypothetical protein